MYMNALTDFFFPHRALFRLPQLHPTPCSPAPSPWRDTKLAQRPPLRPPIENVPHEPMLPLLSPPTTTFNAVVILVLLPAYPAAFSFNAMVTKVSLPAYLVESCPDFNPINFHLFHIVEDDLEHGRGDSQM